MIFLYGKDKTDNLIHIDEAKSGNNDLLCVYCGGKLSAKKGSIVAHHFAHQKGQGENCKGASSAFSRIVLGFDYFDSDLTNVQRQALNILIDRAFIEGYLLPEWESRNPKSAPHILWKHDIKGVNRLTELFQEKGFFERKRIDTPTGNYGQLHPTDKCKLFRLEMDLKQAFATLTHDRNEQAKSIDEQESEMLRLYLDRMAATSLYFLEIHTTQETFYKIGITQREVSERIGEIKSFLKAQNIEIKNIAPLYCLRGLALAEAYFKKKFLKYKKEIDNATEYFCFDKPTLKEVSKQLHQLYLMSDTHKEKIKKALVSRSSTVRKAETESRFLEKPKNKEIAALLAEGIALREIERRTKASINTIRKVAQKIKAA